jgi:hypothetical protein
MCGRYISKVASVGFLGAPLGIVAEPVFLFGLDTPPAQPRTRGRKRVDAMKEKWGKVAPV